MDPGLTALEVWCLAMIGLVFLAFLAYIVILAWLRTRFHLIHLKSIKNLIEQWGSGRAFQLLEYQTVKVGFKIKDSRPSPISH